MQKASFQEKMKKEFKENRVFIIAALLIIILLQGVGTVSVKGVSMEPNFNHSDLVLINKTALLFSKPKRGDIVVCRYKSFGAKEFIIKRVIGLPGDVIDIVEDRENAAIAYVLKINGEAVNEPYIKETMEQPGDCEYPYTVPQDSYFVMGDNRNASSDSRRKEIGVVTQQDMKGKVFCKVYPFSEIKFLK